MYPKPIGPKRPAGNPAFRQPKTDATQISTGSFNGGRNGASKRPAVSNAAMERDQMDRYHASLSNRASEAQMASLAKVNAIAARADRLEAAGYSSGAAMLRKVAMAEANKPVPVVKPRPGSEAALKGAPGGKGRTFDPLGGRTDSPYLEAKPIEEISPSSGFDAYRTSTGELKSQTIAKVRLGDAKRQALLRDHKNYGGINYGLQDKATRFTPGQTPVQGNERFAKRVYSMAAGGNRAGLPMYDKRGNFVPKQR